ncbi:MAG: hypothetical protein AMXMBFR47_21090 [Planctomycetota bacterium]
MSDGGLGGLGCDDFDLAEIAEGEIESLDAGGENSVVVGHQDSHGRGRYPEGDGFARGARAQFRECTGRTGIHPWSR